jgi:hypothetical protein
MVISPPWLYERHPDLSVSNDTSDDTDDPSAKYDGYCLELLLKVADALNFDFELVVLKETKPTVLAYGVR